MGLLKSLTEYEPYTWETGDVITAELLNHMEEGIAAASQGGGTGSDLFIVRVHYGDALTCNHTYAEILEAINDKLDILPLFSYDKFLITGSIDLSGSNIVITLFTIDGTTNYADDSMVGVRMEIYITDADNISMTRKQWTASATYGN